MASSMSARERAQRLFRRLRRQRGMNRVFIIMLLIGIPTAIFHFLSGRYGNGILVSTAVLVGATMLVLDLSSGNRNWWGNPRGDSDPAQGGREEWWN